MQSNSKILVVEDQEGLRELLVHELEIEAFDVDSAGDGDEAIRLLRTKCECNEEYDIILLDIKLPKTDGFQVLRYVKGSTARTRAIMATAYADVGNAIKSQRLGASDFISKPYDLNELLITIRRVLTENK